MQSLRPDRLAARVVAWHNRHPLARRITAAQVTGIGWVSVPYAAHADGTAPAAKPAELAAAAIEQARAQAATGAAGTLRERAAARALQACGPADEDAEAPAAPAAPPDTRRTPVPASATPAATRPSAARAAFDEDFIAPIARRAIARFAAACGSVLQAPPDDAPVRDVLVAPAQAGVATLRCYIATAAVEVGDERIRVLLAPDGTGKVLGPRLIDRRRVAALGAGFAVAAALVTALVSWARAPAAAAPAVEQVAMAAAGGASAAAALAAEAATVVPVAPTLPAVPAVAAVAAVPAVPVMPVTPVVEAASAVSALPAVPAASAAAAPPAASAPIAAAPPVEPASAAAAPAPAARIALRRPVDETPRDLRPLLDEATRAAARAEVAAARAALGRVPPAPAATAASAVAAAASPPATPSPPTAPKAVLEARVLYALSTRNLRTEAESMQLAAATRALLAGDRHRALRVERLPVGEDWRVVAWPFASAAEAEAARRQLASRGLRVQAIEF